MRKWFNKENEWVSNNISLGRNRNKCVIIFNFNYSK